MNRDCFWLTKDQFARLGDRHRSDWARSSSKRRLQGRWHRRGAQLSGSRTISLNETMACETCQSKLAARRKGDRTMSWLNGRRLLAVAVFGATVLVAWMVLYQPIGVSGKLHQNRLTGAVCHLSLNCW